MGSMTLTEYSLGIDIPQLFVVGLFPASGNGKQ
jgi:hypothetical protein